MRTCGLLLDRALDSRSKGLGLDSHCWSCVEMSNENTVSITEDGWMNGVLGHFFALSRLNWAGDNLG